MCVVFHLLGEAYVNLDGSSVFEKEKERERGVRMRGEEVMNWGSMVRKIKSRVQGIYSPFEGCVCLHDGYASRGVVVCVIFFVVCFAISRQNFGQRERENHRDSIFGVRAKTMETKLINA